MKSIFSVSIFIVTILIFMTALATEILEKEQSLITIISPKNGEVVAPSFELTHQVQHGLAPHTIHVFLDGDYQKGATSSLKHLQAGPHELMIKISTDEQDSLVGWDRVNITVK